MNDAIGLTVVLIPLTAVLGLFVGLPWLILHYVTRWKTAPALTSDDEALLDELYQLARRLDERMDTVERLVGADHPDFQPARLERDRSVESPGAELDRFRARRERKAR